MWYPVLSSGDCLRYGRWDDRPYEEISCLYPTWGKTFMTWESPGSWFYKVWDILEANSWLPVAACAIYVLAIHLGQRYMKSRPAWNLRRSLAVWNLLLAVFSAFGFIRMATQLTHNFSHYGFRDSVCESARSMIGSGTTAVWGLAFALSKFAELVDTFFIVVHKKKLMFLHWYHHVTVLICCWHTWVTETPSGLIFCTVNLYVHSIMYFYYFLMAVKCKPKWMNPLFITLTQITQMVAGVFVTFSTIYFLSEGNCSADLTNLKGTLVLYASYLVLFLNFFFERYGIKHTTKLKKRL